MSVAKASHPRNFVRPSQGHGVKSDPAELRHAHFRIALRGFDREEVRAALEDIAADYEALLTKNESLQQQLANLEAMVADYRREESTFRGAVLMVQEQGDQVRQRANHEAQAILNQARVQAAEVIAGARAQARNVEQHIEQLEQRQSQLHATLGREISDLQSVLAKTPHHPDADGKRRQDPPDALSGRPLISHSAAASEIVQPGPSNMKSASAAKNGDDTKDDIKKDDTKKDEKQNHANDRGRLGTRLAAVTSVGVSTGKWGSAAAESKSETVDSIEQIQTILKGVDTFLIKIPGLPDE